MNFDPVKYSKETFSRIEYACGTNFDPLARRFLFFGLFSYPLLIRFSWSMQLLVRNQSKIHCPSNLKMDQNSYLPHNGRITRKYLTPLKWIKVCFIMHRICEKVFFAYLTGSKFISPVTPIERILHVIFSKAYNRFFIGYN